MSAVLSPAIHDRGARHVHRLHMRLPDFSLRPRVETMLEEALRLTTLPGEDQGRVYFFQRLQLPALDLRVPPMQWIARCSQHLLALSHAAVYPCHGDLWRAPAVYFRDQHEPRRLLLASLLAGENPQEWYWPQATGVASDLPPAIRVEHLLEHWHVQPAAWAAVARELLPLLDVQAARTLLGLIRPITAESWLAALTRAGGQISQHASAPPLSAHARQLVTDVRAHFAKDDSRVLFFAGLTVLEASPSLPQDASLLALAALCLQQHCSALTPVRDIRGHLLRRSRSGNALQAVDVDDGPSEVLSKMIGEDETPSITSAEIGTLDHRTGFAGLYFLLHPLRHLGIAEVMETNPRLALTHFVSRVLLRLALMAGVAEEDPILWPLFEDLAEQTGRPCDPLILPANLASLRRLRPSPDLTERLWAAAVHRWCGQHTRMRLSDIIHRPGRIYATATQLDVTIPISAVDLRIRRCGLDLDLGYLPWLGRVIHFHYHLEAQ